MKKKDIAVVAALLALSIVSFIFINAYNRSVKAENVRIYKNGELVYEYDLKDSRRIELEGSVICIENKTVYIESSDCPNRDCVKSGAISKNGEKIICLPKKILIEIGNDKEYDAFT